MHIVINVGASAETTEKLTTVAGREESKKNRL